MKTHTYSGHLDKCLLCFRLPEDPIHYGLASLQYPGGFVLTDLTNQPIESTCAGHTCPSCKDTWKHQYFCGNEPTHGLCLDCAQQTAALINRPAHVEEMGLQVKALDPREAKELHITHQEFIVQNITHIPGQVVDGQQVENPNWQADLAAHIKNLEQMIEKCRVKISAAHQARAAQEVQDLNKLTPEQREQYARDASKPKKTIKAVKEPKESTPVTGSKREKAITSMLKLMRLPNTPESRLEIEQKYLPKKEEE